ncbi:Laccase-14, partial [Mucuna pruriens]
MCMIFNIGCGWLLQVKEKNFTRLCCTKSILTVNDSFPGPTIRVQKGDTAFVTVHNQGRYGVTIHWLHGVRGPRDPWSDGPENITQCPIPPGTSFTQKVAFTLEEGTLWWHAHSSWTRATVHGAIVILPANGTSYPFPEPYAQETLILGEWYKGDVMQIINSALANGREPNSSDSYTINGQPGDFYNCSRETTYHFLVDYGKTYLFRIINAAMNEEFFFGVANHHLSIVGIDASYTKPLNTNLIMITPGQTMDVLVTANQPKGLYYIAASPFYDGTDKDDISITTAILQYSGKYIPSSSSSSIPMPMLPAVDDSGTVFNFTKSLRNLASKDHPANVPTNVTRKIYMTVSMNELPCQSPKGSCLGPKGTRLASSLNNIRVFSEDFPDQPPLFYNFTGDTGSNTLIPSTGTRVLMFDYNEVVELVWQGTSVVTAENHAMHLHGFSFFVVGVGTGNFNNVTDPKSYNLIDPPEVNTIGLPKNGWLAMRFVANNPGVWYMHCHLERHLSWGMDTVLIVRDGGTMLTSMVPPPKYMPP